MHHFDGQVLSARIVDRNGTVLAASYQNLSIFGVAKFPNRLVELNKLICDACLLDVKDPHSS